jgi:hypothetical protein
VAYRSSVSIADAWPSIACTPFTDAPALIRSMKLESVSACLGEYLVVRHYAIVPRGCDAVEGRRQ